MQPHNIPIALQVAGDEREWTTPLWAVETLLKEFSCIKAVQIVEWRCDYYDDFGGDLELAIPANLRYLGEVLKLCGRYGKHLSLQLQSDMAHLATDRLAITAESGFPDTEDERVTWTWKRNERKQWKLIRTEPALPNFGEMLWNSRGHDVKHTMKRFR